MNRPSARSRRAGRLAETASAGWKLILFKILVLGAINALSVYAALVLIASDRLWIAILVLGASLLISWIYLRARGLAAKYLAPGVIFLLIFQIFAVLYSGYIAFTNYGTGHNSSKEDAIHALVLQNQERVPESAAYPVQVVERFGEYSLLVTDSEGNALLGSEDQPLEPVDAEFDGARAVEVEGYETLDFADLLEDQSAVTELTVPLEEDPSEGSLRTPDGTTAYVYTSLYDYDESADTMTDTDTGTVYSDSGEGSFVSDDGEELLPGWRITVGWDNFTRAFTESSIRDPLISVTVWTFAFSFLSVATTFVLGIAVALLLNDKKMRSRKYYRLVMILPYAFPGFLSALVWAGLLNQEFGFINNVFFGGASIPWLTNEWLARASVLLVNLWLGFPYMFLVCTGALQSLPEELTEAARMDGASPFQAFRMVKIPLLLVSIAPLLISAFAFNFNNFNLIYMLTEGGPRDFSADINVGATDILISMVYKVAFVGSSSDYGLASAFAIILFILISVISIISFRRTKSLEELN